MEKSFKIDVAFEPETIEDIKKKVGSVKIADEDDASELVDNALRVYLQLKQIAKDSNSITVVDDDGKRYEIKLE